MNIHYLLFSLFSFGSQANGKPWPGEVASWVCSTVPQAGTVTFDCVPEVAYYVYRVWCGKWFRIKGAEHDLSLT